MRITGLIRALERMRDERGNVEVAVDVKRFRESSESRGENILWQVSGIEFVYIEAADDDECLMYNANGAAKMLKLAVLKP